MKTIEPFVHLSYSKDFRIPLKDLEPLKQTIKAEVKNLEKKEQEYLCNLLNIPEASRIHISFVQSMNPTWKDGAGYVDPLWVNGNMAYKTLEEAFENKADTTMAWIKLDKIFQIDGKDCDYFPVDFRLSLFQGKEGENAHYGLSVGGHYGTGSDIWERPLDYQRYGFEKAYELVDKIDALVPEKREPIQISEARH